MRLLSKSYVLKSIYKDTMTLTLWGTIGRSAGFMVPFFIAAWFGTSLQTDAFFFAYSIILFLAGIFSPVVENVIVPYLMELKVNGKNTEAFISNILCLSFILLIVLFIPLVFISKPLLNTITDFENTSIILVYRILLEISPLLFFLTWTSILTGVLNTHKRFTLPALSPAFRAIINLFFIYIFKDVFGIHAVSFGYAIGELIRLGILSYTVKRFNLFRFRFSLSINRSVVGFLKSAFFQMASMITIGINPFIDKSMATWLGEGNVTILHYADRLYIIPVSIFVSGLMVILLSHWSEMYYHHGVHKVLQMMIKNTVTVCLAASVITALLILFHDLIVKLIFDTGGLSSGDILKIDFVWMCYMVGFIPYILGLIFVQAHLVFKNTKPLLYLSALNCFFNIILNYGLMKKFHVSGIALSTSIASVITTIGLFLSLRRTVNKIKMTENNSLG